MTKTWKDRYHPTDVIDRSWRGDFSHDDHERIPVVVTVYGKAFHAPGKMTMYDITNLSTRCNNWKGGLRDVAGNAIRMGKLPCTKCFPDDPIETWNVDPDMYACDLPAPQN